jgi:hypothetical protein
MHEPMKAGGEKTNTAARRRRLMLAMCTIVVTWTLTACETASVPAKARMDDAAMAEAKAAPLSQSNNVIHVLPVEGLDNPLRLVLADAVAASLRDTERPAVLSEIANNQGPSILAAIENVRERGSVVWVSSVWKLRAPYGTIVAERKREMVIDKTLWQRTSVETVNLIIDDAMPAVSDMVRDFVGPAHLADSEASEANWPSNTVGSETAATPILGRGTSPSTLPPEVGAPAPPAPLDNMVFDLPATMETDAETVPRPARQSSVAGAASSSAPGVSPVPAVPASRPPMVLAPRDEIAQQTGLTAEEMTVKPLEETPARGMPAKEMPSEPMPLSAPPPPKTMAGIDPPTGDTPVRWGKPSFLIRTVRGAPGDGNRALVLAITTALRGKDLTVTEDPRQAGYEVVGSVDVGPPVNGRQRARITWAVNTMGGEEIGKAVQENVVAAGSLGGSWGRVAVLVSSAAANGIHQLFESPRPKYTPVGEVPDFPKIPKLPRVPGRALPPPS